MADEFTISTQVTYNSSLAREEFSESFNDDQATNAFYSAILSVTTSCAALSEGSLTTPGWVCVKNLDPSNFIEIGPDSGGVGIFVMRVDPLESFCFKMSTVSSLRVRADTATCKLQVKMWER